MLLLCSRIGRKSVSSSARVISSTSVRFFSSSVQPTAESQASSAAATVASMAAQHPKDEDYLNSVIPKRIQLFQSIQAKLLADRRSLPSDRIELV